MQNNPNRLAIQMRIIRNFFEGRIDRLIIYKSQRWAFFFAFLLLFVFRMIYLQAYFAVGYVFGFYTIQKIILYFTPSTLPSITDEEENEEEVFDIPNVVLDKNEDSSKPIVRKLGEFKLWKKIFLAASISLTMTFFSIFDLPVFWPILLLYFFLVAATIVLKQKLHMKKYGYSLSDFFKKREER